MALGRPDVSVIIPAYNEEKRLAPTVRDAVEYFRGRARSVEIIVVDDGSRDRTSDLTHHLGAEMREVRLIRSPTVRDAVEYFRGRARSVEIIVVDDGSRDRTSDLTHHLGAEMREVRLI